MKAKLAIVALATLAAIGSAQAVEVSTELASVSIKAHDFEIDNTTSTSAKVLRVGLGHTFELDNGVKLGGSVKVGKAVSTSDDASAFDGSTYKGDLTARLTVGKAVGGVDLYGGLQHQRFEIDGPLSNVKQSQNQAFVGVSIPKPLADLPSLQSVSFEAGTVLGSTLKDSGDYGNGWETFTVKNNGGSVFKVAAAFKAGDYTISPFVASASPSADMVKVKTSQVGVSVSRSF